MKSKRLLKKRVVLVAAMTIGMLAAINSFDNARIKLDITYEANVNLVNVINYCKDSYAAMLEWKSTRDDGRIVIIVLPKKLVLFDRRKKKRED